MDLDKNFSKFLWVVIIFEILLKRRFYLLKEFDFVFNKF